MTGDERLIVVCGATGRQGGAVVRSLLGQGWRVRGLTRKPQQSKARELVAAGAEMVAADMEDPATLRGAFEGANGVFSVQNGLVSGFDREIAQGRHVADVAKQSGVSHLVYASAGTGESGTGIRAWEAKLEVERHMRRLDLPHTSLRPEAFMELMTDSSFYPAVGTWRIWPRLSGEDRPIPWLAVEDVGQVAAAVFADPGHHIGHSIVLVGDVLSLAECRALYREVMGNDPRTFPLPIWLFDRFTRHDVTEMWRWLRTGAVELDTGPTRQIHPGALTVREWLVKIRDLGQG
jgi:uncharacterized protein YbjT (DUF2867 family)